MRPALSLAFLFLLAPLAGAQPAQAPVEAVEFASEDGWTLHADYAPAKDAGAPVVILLHQYRAARASWRPLLGGLQAAGLHALAIDQRAHGASTQKGSQQLRVAEVPREEFPALVRQGPRDVAAGLAFLRRRGLAAKRVLLCGASYGCTVSILSSAQLPEVAGLALLSPGKAYFGVDVAAPLEKFKGRVLIAVAKGDGCYRDLRALQRAATVPAVLVVEGRQHGTRLLGQPLEPVRYVGLEVDAAQPLDLRPVLVRWARTVLAGGAK